jgi:hypothetical protein
MIQALLDRATRVVAGSRDAPAPAPGAGGRARVAERAALAATALSVAPIRYATRPVGAEELVARRTCANCPSGSRCCAGYTALCCTLPGETNFGCPNNTFVGGWWQCNYGAKGLCGTTNVRYYLDCSIRPGKHCPGGCHCGGDDCHNFKSCCIRFRYGQCSTHIGAVTPIMCRLVTCVIPCRIDCLDCRCSSAVDQATCKHNAGCLER